MATRKHPSSKATPKRVAPAAHQPKTAQRPAASRRLRRRTGSPIPPKGFLIVGIGTSATGLKATEEFFRHMPAASGMAFVVVLHALPYCRSFLPSILGRCTPMPVFEAAEELQVEPNCIYIAPPDGSLAIRHATLHCLETTEAQDTRFPIDAFEAQDTRFPIDAFFRTLAADQQEQAVGIVLSGTGTDGILGLKAIKDTSGMTMVQEPQLVGYDGMLSSAVATGFVDHVLAPSAMPERLLLYAQNSYMQGEAGESIPTLSDALDRILLLLRARIGHDFSGYKLNTIRRRMARRMSIHQIADLTQYLGFLQEHPYELDLLFKDLLISVTSFFRDPEAFDSLAATVLPEILARQSAHSAVRVWVPGCATGEEAYALGILLQEGRERASTSCKVQIFATDLDNHTIEIARSGIYPESIATDIRADRLARFFTKEDTSYRIVQEIRDMVIFATHNLLVEPPFTKLDLLSCRNLLIYLDTSLQKRLLHMFHYALRPGRFLFLGPSERMNAFDSLFTAVDTHWRLFRRKDTAGAPSFLADLALPVKAQRALDRQVAAGSQQDPSLRLATLIDKLLVARYAPPSVIINDRGDIVHIHGRTGAYLEPASGQPSLNVLAMAREGLRLPLTAAIRQATARGDETVLERVRVKTNDHTILVHVTVQRISEPEMLQGLLRVSFEPVAEVASSSRPRVRGRAKTSQEDREAELERELQHTREALQNTEKEIDAAYDEYKSTTEEVQSINEELQSTNEELETAREELHSLNEELQTVNVELQNKVEALSEAHDDMTNLLHSIDIATIFLDTQLHIKRFTPQAKKVFNLMQSDVGRPLSDLMSSLRYDRVVHDAQEVLHTLVPTEHEVQTHTDTLYRMRMRPYRTARNVIDGVVMTFVDITQLKHAELAAQDALAYAESIIATVHEPVVVLDAVLQVLAANRAFQQFSQGSRNCIEGQCFYDLDGGQWNIPKLRDLLEDMVAHQTTVHDLEIEHDFRDIGRKTLLLNACRTQRQPAQPDVIVLTIEDITTRRRAGEA